MSAVDVYLGGRHVGALAHRSDLGDATEFRLTREFLELAERPVLGQLFVDDPERTWKTTHRIPAWFSNLLPEGVLRGLLAASVDVNPERELHLLAALGADLPGAVTVEPRGELHATPIRPGRPPVTPDEALRFSLAGLQLKFSVTQDERGLTIPVRGQGGRWIAKLPDPRYTRVPENEDAMLSWAEQIGCSVPEHRLTPVSEIRGLPAHLATDYGGRALIIRRFDRLDDGSSVHIEDFAQVRGVFPEAKYSKANYESIGRILFALCGESCLEEYVRRLVFMVISGNADLHLKNWSLIYPDGRNATLSPAYDLVATLAYAGTSKELALKLGKTRSFAEVNLDTFRRLAGKIGVDPGAVGGWAEEARDRALEVWPNVSGALTKRQATRLGDHLSRLRL